MKKLAKIILSSITYEGANIGDDLRFEININGQKIVFEKQLVHKQIDILDKEISNIFIESDTKVSLSIKVIEEDEVFDDVGEINN